MFKVQYKDLSPFKTCLTLSGSIQQQHEQPSNNGRPHALDAFAPDTAGLHPRALVENQTVGRTRGVHRNSSERSRPFATRPICKFYLRSLKPEMRKKAKTWIPNERTRVDSFYPFPHSRFGASPAALRAARSASA